jgi:hypothetical protein
MGYQNPPCSEEYGQCTQCELQDARRTILQLRAKLEAKILELEALIAERKG